MNKAAKPTVSVSAAAILQEAFLLQVSRGANHTFTCEDILHTISDRIHKASVSRRVSKLMGGFFRKFSTSLKLIRQTGRVQKSTRPHHDGQVIHVWEVIGSGSECK